ncbi:hypothetical protein M3Y99_01036900 [Aphelenchoides fujianensis]|nr:hypothetical protein M3Y99_01036900 [Aphelenchoides fujianensis]
MTLPNHRVLVMKYLLKEELTSLPLSLTVAIIADVKFKCKPYGTLLEAVRIENDSLFLNSLLTLIIGPADELMIDKPEKENVIITSEQKGNAATSSKDETERNDTNTQDDLMNQPPACWRFGLPKPGRPVETVSKYRFDFLGFSSMDEELLLNQRVNPYVALVGQTMNVRGAHFLSDGRLMYCFYQSSNFSVVDFVRFTYKVFTNENHYWGTAWDRVAKTGKDEGLLIYCNEEQKKLPIYRRRPKTNPNPYEPLVSFEDNEVYVMAIYRLRFC